MQQQLYKEQNFHPIMLEYLDEMCNHDFYDECFDASCFSIKIDLSN